MLRVIVFFNKYIEGERGKKWAENALRTTNKWNWGRKFFLSKEKQFVQNEIKSSYCRTFLQIEFHFLLFFPFRQDKQFFFLVRKKRVQNENITAWANVKIPLTIIWGLQMNNERKKENDESSNECWRRKENVKTKKWANGKW